MIETNGRSEDDASSRERKRLLLFLEAFRSERTGKMS